jgi:UDP-N-acetylmuramyl pentapeptide phosphotransferase/UDP-N-acetylglucosamine-1-phosphate transferase
VVSALLIALSANLLNLLDLRPLRTLKGFWLLSAGLLWAADPLLSLLWGLSLPYARLEARRRVMLGDTGANALGGVVGVSAALLLPLWAQAAVVALLLGFHLWAEKHSLSAWIEAHAWARRIDGWGWRTEAAQDRLPR